MSSPAMSSPAMSGPAPGDAIAVAFGPPIRHGDWLVRLAGPGEFPALAALRGRAFRDGGADSDAFDTRCLHLWVGPTEGSPAATARLQVHPEGHLSAGYAARFYDLAPMAALPGPSLELGRLCLDPARPDPDLLRLVWAGITRLAETTGAARLIGCTSFRGTDPAAHAPALAILAARHLGPPEFRPLRRAVETFDLGTLAPLRGDGAAMAGLPALLRAYLALGGWVSDHLVIDRDLGTCHVFTCVEIATMPEARKRVLRALATTPGTPG